MKSLWRWAAAAAAVLVLISAIWLIWGQKQNLLTYETGFGETEEILLDDGTSVILNANSTIIWDSDWENSGIRSAELQGEAYFEVSHKDIVTKGGHKIIPFNVQTPDWWLMSWVQHSMCPIGVEKPMFFWNGDWLSSY